MLLLANCHHKDKNKVIVKVYSVYLAPL